MGEGTLLSLGVVAAFLGITTIQDARNRQGRITAMGWAWSAAGGYGAYTNAFHFQYGGNSRLAVLALW